ncbi:MAG: class I SAM-dependent methyltransferase [Burkholderiaceae bacterium]
MQNSMQGALKSMIRKVIVKTLSKRTSDLIFSVKHRKTWRSDRHSHFEYTKEYLTRLPLIQELQKLTAVTNRKRPRIIEFGCSGANNLRLIKTLLPNHEYCGVDINQRAIDFARQQFPDATFHVCDEDGFSNLASQSGHYDVFLAFSVLYYIRPDKVEDLLIKASFIANYIFICDDLTCFHLPEGRNDGLFMHPFSAMCRTAGLDIIVGPVYFNEPGNRHGYFIARSSHGPGKEYVS